MIILKPNADGKFSFHDVPQFTRSPSYRVNVPWATLEYKLNDWENETLFTLDLSPDFQRAHVWTEEQQVRYVEYILRGGKSGRDTYWNHPNWNRNYRGSMVLVDGKQRINAVRRFLRNEIGIFGSVTYDQFSDNLPYDADFVFNVNDLPTRSDVLRWYIDLNAGGVAHTDEEIARVRHLLEKEQRQ